MQLTIKMPGFIVLLGLAAINLMGLPIVNFDPEKPIPIPKSVQRSGNAAKGYTYLTTGDYVKGGVPYDFYLLGKGKEKNNYLKRTGINGTVSHDFTVIKAVNGENLVAPNCLQCHAQVFNEPAVPTTHLHHVGCRS